MKNLIERSKNDRKYYEEQINGAVNNPAAQASFISEFIGKLGVLAQLLSNAIESVEDAFLKSKAAHRMANRKDEKPHEIAEQVTLASRFRLGAFVSIALDGIVNTFSIWNLVSQYFWNPFTSFSISLVIAAVLTASVAWVLHAAISLFFNTPNDPVKGYQRLKWTVILPSFLAFILSVAGSGAVRMLDPDTLLWAESAISITYYLAVFAFLALGTGLLVASDIHDWSVKASNYYYDLEVELQECRNALAKYKESQGVLSDHLDSPSNSVSSQEISNVESSSNPKAFVPESDALALTPVVAKTVIPKRDSANGTLLNGLKSGAVGLTILASLFGASCGEPKIKRIPVTEKVQLSTIFDASSIENRKAYEEAVHHVRDELPTIIEKFRVTNIGVYWFGDNAWNAEEKWSGVIPPYNVIETVPSKKNGEFQILKDRVQAASELKEQQRREVAKQEEDGRFRNQIKEALCSLTHDIMLPPQSVSSPETDVNGVFARFSQPVAASKHVVLIVTDGQQNKNHTFTINTPQTLNNTIFIVILVPGRVDAGQSDFEIQREKFKAACSSCFVFPHYTTDIANLINNVEENNLATVR